jgi:hypothetical protein
MSNKTIGVPASGLLEVRTYLAPGENRTINVTALPCLGLGRRF